MTETELEAARQRLKVTNTLSRLASQYDPHNVMEAARGWVAYMDGVETLHRQADIEAIENQIRGSNDGG